MEQPREPSGTPVGGQFASTHGAVLSTGDFRKGTPEHPVTLDKLITGNGPIGEIHVEVYRVGAFADVNDKPLMEGRGLFFADSATSAKPYSIFHKGHEVTKYVVNAKSAYVTKSQFSLSKEVLGKTFQDAIFDEEKKLFKVTNGQGDSVKAARIVEEKMFKKLRAKGHDAVILTDPPDPAKHELAVIKKTASIKRRQ